MGTKLSGPWRSRATARASRRGQRWPRGGLGCVERREGAGMEGGHRGGGVLSVAFSADGTRVASGGLDGRVVLWDASSGEQVREMEGGHGGRPVYSVAFAATQGLESLFTKFGCRGNNPKLEPKIPRSVWMAYVRKNSAEGAPPADAEMGDAEGGAPPADAEMGDAEGGAQGDPELAPWLEKLRAVAARTTEAAKKAEEALVLPGSRFRVNTHFFRRNLRHLLEQVGSALARFEMSGALVPPFQVEEFVGPSEWSRDGAATESIDEWTMPDVGSRTHARTRAGGPSKTLLHMVGTALQDADPTDLALWEEAGVVIFYLMVGSTDLTLGADVLQPDDGDTRNPRHDDCHKFLRALREGLRGTRASAPCASLSALRSNRRVGGNDGRVVVWMRRAESR